MLIRIHDDSEQTVLARQAEEASTHWTRFRGLMGRRGLEDGGGLVIRPCKSIHMMFMRFAIDAVFFDKENRVTRVALNVRPWIGMAWGGGSAVGVIELPSGAAAKLRPGDRLDFDE
ncbi:MAG: DUF192 domain-containing protein [Chloroflexi bacterium]|nr:DUF192 domain-containing protein [Chloroflexota bacterium]MDA1146136.1 DUF192 domain-containing protein [Chloroflexota bacterium]